MPRAHGRGSTYGMFDVSSTIDDTGCAICGSFTNAERYVRMRGAFVLVFCSRDCLGADARAQRLRARAGRSRAARRLLLGATLLAAWLVPHEVLWRRRSAPATPPTVSRSEVDDPIS